jgi:hypothetical protein
MGAAGGELLIPTLILLFGADIKLAGSLSLAVSLPTMIVGFARYSRDQSFSVIGRNRVLLLTMAAGSVVGSRPDTRTHLNLSANRLDKNLLHPKGRPHTDVPQKVQGAAVASGAEVGATAKKQTITGSETSGGNPLQAFGGTGAQACNLACHDRPRPRARPL